MQLTNQTKAFVMAAGVLALFTVPLRATSITATVFATGALISSTSPDSMLFGDGSLWVSYQNGADSTGAFGSSTVARYTLSGSLVNTWTITGNVDGLPVDPNPA
jgi:glutamine cyclotransferase